MERRRRAFICEHKSHTEGSDSCAVRVFLPPEVPEEFVPECGAHGKMKRQANAPYNGRKVAS